MSDPEGVVLAKESLRWEKLQWHVIRTWFKAAAETW